MSGDGKDGRLVRAVMELARQPSFRVVAESIETAEKVRALAAMHRDLG